MVIYKVECEWDIGLGNKAFASIKVAWDYAGEAVNMHCNYSLEEMKEQGLISLETIYLIE
tara:strand:- start:24191 stop:24370 length:180 start_codon:yes stop_codon:yes gene_type:complete